MREIKFRVWCDGKYHNEDYNILFSDGSWKIEDWETGKTKYIYKENDGVIEQYTGLKDKNGVEIYENDLVEVHNVFPNNKEEKFKGVIVYENGAYLVRLDKFDSPIRNQYDDDIVHYIGYIEVIGNIHEGVKVNVFI